MAVNHSARREDHVVGLYVHPAVAHEELSLSGPALVGDGMSMDDVFDPVRTEGVVEAGRARARASPDWGRGREGVPALPAPGPRRVRESAGGYHGTPSAPQVAARPEYGLTVI